MEMTAIRTALAERLRGIRDEDDYVMGVLVLLKTDKECEMMNAFIDAVIGSPDFSWDLPAWHAYVIHMCRDGSHTADEFYKIDDDDNFYLDDFGMVVHNAREREDS